MIWFVLASGTRWGDVPAELGCSGRTAHRRLRARGEGGIRDRLHADLLRLLRQADKLDADPAVVDGVTTRAFGGGGRTGPRPADRGRPGTKHTPMVSRSGVPPAVHTAGADAGGHTRIIPLVPDFPEVGGKPGRPKGLPDEVCADRGCGSESTRRILRRLGGGPKIAKRKTPHGSGPGRVRWVVERTTRWLEGAAADAGPARPARDPPGRLHHPGRQRHLLPHPQRRRLVVKPVLSEPISSEGSYRNSPIEILDKSVSYGTKRVLEVGVGNLGIGVIQLGGAGKS